MPVRPAICLQRQFVVCLHFGHRRLVRAHFPALDIRHARFRGNGAEVGCVPVSNAAVRLCVGYEEWRSLEGLLSGTLINNAGHFVLPCPHDAARRTLPYLS
jgi:hypothetical protein